MNRPAIIFVITFFLLWLAALGGGLLRKRWRYLTEDERSDFGVILAATMTLLGLIIGFSFSMATGRYDLRKTYEEAEANAIGTEYVRAEQNGSGLVHPSIAVPSFAFAGDDRQSSAESHQVAGSEAAKVTR